MRGGRLVILGDSLLDRDLVGRVDRVSPDAPVPVVEDIVEATRAGGAALAADLAAGDGRPVTLITALGDDPAGRELARLIAAAGVECIDVGMAGTTPEKVRVRSGGQSLVRLDYGGSVAGVPGDLTPEALAALQGADGVLVCDYGRGMSANATVRAVLAALPRRKPIAWDPHPKGTAPVAGVRLVTPNRAEAGLAAGASLAEVTRSAHELRRRWEAAAVAVTLGDRGALLVDGDGAPLVVPVVAAASGDPCGAGDRFASAAAGLLADGALVSEAVRGAVAAASAFVAAGGAASLHRPAAADTRRSSTDAASLARRTREGGGTVVTTGGCFDLVHAGHIGVLQAARSLGDCLIVCLNSDASVRRLKGPSRPLQGQEDRAAVLLALGCVDAVAIFDEDTPERLLDDLRPHVFAKGADYSIENLPEAALLEGWGGQAVVLPYLEGRSTTRLLQEARRDHP
ncbi:MAG: ADP-heptose synthase / D-glycero-beta-D-manno-heptose 7-phosphate kinase [uncultured Acidimicrobiales bacterium]|uniref:D-glycero-beta-D-manno-heptose 1-phosphate adenylyltransferase n=1 Tax=uncultured Acidimicrobiales bacterium TaxID=310071 RepID=A0A6J4IAI0_9ACTN|nr:MAG: ADP-heptose synthase / D-glycero-beta-D-manno-heptose 7-phosphate kinase [uncultured Acidimicrobiales bacterium]